MADKKPKKLKQYEKFDLLLQAVMRDTPSDVAKKVEEFGELEFTALALGAACRYRGLDMVKVLVEGGAKFTYDLAAIIPLYKRADRPLEIGCPDENYAAALLNSVGAAGMYRVYQAGKIYQSALLPINARISVLSYLCRTADKTGFDKDELLFFAYFSGERKIIDLLKKNGAVLPERWVNVITEGGNNDRWLNYCYMVQQIPDESFIPFMTALISENAELGGKKLHMTDWLWYVNEKRRGMPGFMRFMLENFDLSKLNKGKLMKEIILCDDTESLAAVAENGWLKLPKKRDEMIGFAAENKKSECAAWLLDFKNRTADLKAERERAERRERRELNADPTTPTAMKKLWAWKTREDGTLIITGYKGDKTHIVVPSNIGKNSVTAIGEYAFSPDAKYIRSEQCGIRRNISVVELPDSITEIGEFAFFKCKSLKIINIPEKLTEIPKGMLDLTGIEEIEIGGSVKKIGAVAFYGCTKLKTAVLREGVEEIDSAAFYHCDALETVDIPRSVITIAYDKDRLEYFTKKPENPFTGCGVLTILLYKGSYAEAVCGEIGLSFEYKDDQQ